ncbi:ABC transporter permease [Ruania alba]|uniref:Peptide/nickel transport system permease protein n=1 Tax=Ruania alba TaxID=648782 RepID=A0A1H5HN91_9MICO|nr:ABC transporter permease [Ruania alba]SEE29472.1 peptide/nickel transport system permease protein [Ruania alba]
MSLLDNPASKALDGTDDAIPLRGGAAVRGWEQLRTWPFVLRVGVGALLTIVVILLLTPLIAPYDPATQELGERLSGPTSEHLLGTDQLGRDVLSRLMWGGRFSVSIAAVTLVISSVVGTLIGLIAARVRGPFDEFVMRLSDILLAFPEMIVAMFLVAVIGPSYGTLILALVIGGWTPFARLARSLALEINARDFVEAAESLGMSRRYIIMRHLLPNALSPLLAHAALRFGHKLITVGGLSYLGLGVQPPDSDWGSMLADGQPYMTQEAGLVIYPGLAIFLAALAVTLIGQGINVRRARQE